MAFEGYRKMLFRALKKPNGQVVVTDPEYLAHTTKVVANESDYYVSVGQGWCEEPQEALDQFEKEEQRIGNEASYRAAAEQKMSELARKEAEAYEKTVPLAHVPVIPEQVKPPKPTQSARTVKKPRLVKTPQPRPRKSKG